MEASIFKTQQICRGDKWVKTFLPQFGNKVRFPERTSQMETSQPKRLNFFFCWLRVGVRRKDSSFLCHSAQQLFTTSCPAWRRERQPCRSQSLLGTKTSSEFREGSLCGGNQSGMELRARIPGLLVLAAVCPPAGKNLRGANMGTFWGKSLKVVRKPDQRWIHVFFSEDVNSCKCGGKEAGSGFKIKPNARKKVTGFANDNVVVAPHNQSCIFFPQGEFYNWKKQHFNHQNQETEFIKLVFALVM